ncbi:hypothetical protein EL18_00625 [Nitratireductor basaltis]|uniref:Uncharacterized protein n=1 Tax=Nitratireductor basaltis TaxID=472175 RepID=A0A084U9H3_9HYPH|nr:hypothetical protein EL18_00625 [Nitratireductor basaltis]
MRCVESIGQFSIFALPDFSPTLLASLKMQCREEHIWNGGNFYWARSLGWPLRLWLDVLQQVTTPAAACRFLRWLTSMKVLPLCLRR